MLLPSIIRLQFSEIIAFAGVYPYEIKEGHYYPVDLGLTIFDELELRALDRSLKEVEQIDDSFSYFIRGRLNGDCLESAINFKNEWFLDYYYMTGEFVEVIVDKLVWSFWETKFEGQELTNKGVAISDLQCR